MVCGKLMYFVSGKKYTKKEIKIDGKPSVNIGKGFQMHANFDINGAEIPNILETVEHVPIAWFLRLVGYNSPVIK